MRILVLLFLGCLEVQASPHIHNRDIASPIAFGTPPSISTFSNAGSLSLANNATLTLTGPNATVVTGSSVTASSFYGDGTNLTGTAGSSSYISSSTVIQSSITANTSFGPCMAGSTITITSNGHAGKLTIVARKTNTVAAGLLVVGILEDGALFDGETSSLGFGATGSVASDTMYAEHKLQTNLSAGSHSFCLVFYKSAASTTISLGGSGTQGQSYFTYEEW